MIGWLKGKLRARRDDALLVDVGGVGYLVQVPLSVAADKALGAEVELHVHTQVREDLLALFGFETMEQLATFETLISVSGVGPKLAVGILGAITPGGLAAAIETADHARLKALPGVGKRLAERLPVELKGKLDVAPEAIGAAATAPAPRVGGVWRDLRSALENLQYRPKEVDAALAQLGQELPDAEFDALLRAALNLLKR